MVTALQDLRNRIASNTLTGAQQAALTVALDAMIPTFPSPDELANSIPVPEEGLAREWIAPLYTLQAEAGPGGSVLPTTQPAFFVNALTGSNSNDGLTPVTPLQTIAALAALWRGTAGGGRPVLASTTGTTTVTLQTDFPVSDPLAPILDVDITLGGTLLIVGTPKAAAHNGTVATANAWAKTVANGQVRITDALVADFHPFVGTASLFVDNTAAAVAWLYAPDPGASATGTMTVGYQPITAGVATVPTQSNIVPGNLYSLLDLQHVSLGQGFTTRSFPEDGTATVNNANVFLYRLHFIDPGSTPVTNLTSRTVGYNFQECQYDHMIVCQDQIATFVNCFGFHSQGINVQAGSLVELIAGGISGQVSGTVQVATGGTVLIDADFALFSGAAYQVASGIMEMGNASRWNNGGSQALSVVGGSFILTPTFQASAVFYGTDAGGAFATVFSIAADAGTVIYPNVGGTPAQTAFVFTDVVFNLGTLGGSSFSMSQTTGLAVGPTTNTLAHLDAAIGAGTGFGGAAIDPRSGSTFRIAA